MKIKQEVINDVPDRMIYWTRLHFVSQNGSKKTTVLAAASYEYLEDFFRIPSEKNITDQHLNLWVENIIKKWSKLNDDIFKNKVHFDSYVSDSKFEPNLIDFLVKNIKV